MIRLFVLQILIIFLFLSNNSIASNQNIFEDAKLYFEKKDYNQSKFLFQKFLVFNPKDHLSYLYLAKIYKEEDDKIETEKNLNTTLLLNPKNEEALFMLIELQLEKSNFSKAKELNEKFLLICSKLCNNKSIISEKIKNLEPKKITNQ
jgi:tetratricopeptide (TPR) repeat protein